MILKRYISVLIIVLLNVSCYTSRDLSTKNMASFYKPTDNIYHPEFSAWNQRDSSIQLFVKVIPAEFLYVRQSDEGFKSFVKVVLEVVRSYDDTRVLDSTSSVFTFDILDKSVAKIVNLNLPTKQVGDLMLRVVLYDLNKGAYEDYFVPLEIDNQATRNDFLFTNRRNEILFDNYGNISDSLNIAFKDPAVKTMWCKYYKRNFSLPAPPFSFDIKSEFDYTPDSVFQVSVNDSFPIVFPEPGFYHLQPDTTKKGGATIYRFEPGFPNVSTPQHLLESMRYLTSKKEFEEMRKSVNLKAAVDNFWLARGGSEEKTRALIRKYYGRVQDANKYFTSYTEGWRTDRGMIYVIFGAPSTLYLSAESETWIYGTPNSTLALNFFFTKVINPFTPNDMTLSRAPIYESNWYRAVETWRQGRAYNSYN